MEVNQKTRMVGWRIENGGRKTAGSSAESAPGHCSETAVTPLHILEPQALAHFRAVTLAVTLRYILGFVTPVGRNINDKAFLRGNAVGFGELDRAAEC